MGDFQTFGEELRKARAQKAQSLDDIASQLKIHRRHLEAIEAGELSKLPQGPYAKAFVREYARAVGLTVPDSYWGGSEAPEKGPTISLPHPGALARSAVKTVTKTTESVVNMVETSGKDALEVLTSKSLWDEAENVRRERHGLPPLEPKPEVKPAHFGGQSPGSSPPAEVSESANHLPDPESRTVTYIKRKASSKGTTNLIIGLLALLFAGAAFFAIRMSRSNSNGTAGADYVPAPVERPTAENGKADNAKRKEEAGKTAPPPVSAAAISPKDSLQFTLRATQPVWISIAPDGVPAYRGQLKVGEVRSFHAAEKIVVDLGNQKFVEMQLNGQRLSNLPAIPNSSVVVRNLVLTRDRATLGSASVDMKKVTAVPPASSQASVAHVAPIVPAPVKTNANKPSGTAKAGSQNAHANHPQNSGTNAQRSTTPKSQTSQPPSKRGKKQQKSTQPPPGEIHTVEPIPPRI